MIRSNVVLLILSLSSSLSAADWPQWQGPQRDAMSQEHGLMQQWEQGGPPLAWRIDDLGGGYSAPSVVAGRLYGLSNRGDDEVVWCLSEENGQEIWATRLGPAYKEGMRQGIEGPGCSPTVHDGRVYVIGAGGAIGCLQAHDGAVVWQRDLQQDFAGRLPVWRYNESPLVDGDKVICTPGGEETSMIALHKQTGDLIWKSQVPDAQPSGGNAGGSTRGRRSPMESDLVLKALDRDGNREISAAELDSAAQSLAALDKDHDGSLSEAEVAPAFGNRGGGGGAGRSRGRGPGGGGMMRMMPANKALDADEDGTISAEEIKLAAASLKTLDKDGDGKLTDAEVSPQFGRRGPASGAAYASPIAIDVQGTRQYVQLTATTLAGVDATDGRLLWRYDRAANGNRINCSTPIFRDGLVFAASAYGNGGGAVRLTKDGEAFRADEVYFTSDMQNHHGGMIVLDGCLYGANGGNGGGFLVCLDFQTGELLWRDRKAPKGSLVFADQRIYLRSEEGTMVLIEPSSSKFVERGRFEQPDRTTSPAWTHPVIANGRMYIRDQNLLLCYDIKKTP